MTSTSRHACGRSASVCALAIATLLGADISSAQVPLRGQVLRDDLPLAEATVVLHYVSPDSAGEVDSVRVDPEGRFDFELTAALDGGEDSRIYFASVRHQDVLYFGQAIAQARQLDSLYVIRVHDAVAAPVTGADLPLTVRNLFLEQVESGWRATDLYQIRNDGPATLVTTDGGVVWAHPLPPAAADPQLGQGDLAPEGVSFRDGRVEVRAPLPPGERLLLIRYMLPALPLSIPVTSPTEVMELLVLEPAPWLDAAPLQRVETVALDGSSYGRYSATSLQGVDLVLEEADPPASVPVREIAVMLAFVMTLAGLLAYYRPRARAAGARVSAGEGAPKHASSRDSGDRQALILEVARVDEALDVLADEASEERDRLQARRAALLAELRSLS